MLRAEATSDARQLLLHVAVKNPHAEAIYLQHLLFDWYELLGDARRNPRKNPEAEPTAELAFVCASKRPGEVFALSGDGPEPPPGVQVLVPRIPWANRLEPGHEHSKVLTFPLPLLEWHGYEPPKREPTRQVSITQLRYRLDYSLASTALQPNVHLPGAFVARGKVQSFEITVPLPSPVILFERTDPIERFG
jgi:hypothetical protein